DVARFCDAGGLAHHVVELTGGPHALAFELLVVSEDDPGEVRGGVGHLVERPLIAIDVVENTLHLREFAADVAPRAPQHDPLAAQIRAESLRILEPLLASVAGAPLAQELLAAAEDSFH